jgi:hypothetical protein
MGFECPWQHRCPHLDGRSIHYARLRLDTLPRTVDDLRLDLQETSKELDQAHQEIQDLRKQVAHYKSQWQVLHRKQFKTNIPSSGASSEKVASTGSVPIPPKKKKKRGAPLGHPGWHRRKPSTVDQWVEVAAPTQCPDCGCRSLKAIEECCEHLQEDIVLQIRPVVTGYRHHQAHCPHCMTTVIQEGAGEMWGSPIGPVTKATATEFISRWMSMLVKPVCLTTFKRARLSSKSLMSNVSKPYPMIQSPSAGSSKFKIFSNKPAPGLTIVGIPLSIVDDGLVD